VADCKWHKGEIPIPDDEPVGCQDCGKLFWTKTCESCGKTFLDWTLQGHDDVMSAPYIIEDGDILCYTCYIAWVQDKEQEEYEEAYDNDYSIY